MQPHNGTGASSWNVHMFDDRIDSVKASAKRLVDRVTLRPSGEPTRVATFASKATAMIKAHPFAAAATALGLGYVIVRLARK